MCTRVSAEYAPKLHFCMDYGFVKKLILRLVFRLAVKARTLTFRLEMCSAKKIQMEINVLFHIVLQTIRL